MYQDTQLAAFDPTDWDGSATESTTAVAPTSFFGLQQQPRQQKQHLHTTAAATAATGENRSAAQNAITSKTNTASAPTPASTVESAPADQREHCSNVDSVKTTLRRLIDEAAQGTEPAWVSHTFALSADTLIDISFPAPQSRKVRDTATTFDQDLAWSVRDLANLADDKDRRRWQRGAARGLLTAVQDVDGFKYSVSNSWNSKDDAGFRFSYTCQDSKDIKDRQLNSGRKSIDSTAVSQDDLDQSHDATSVRVEPRTSRKQTFDCKGHVVIKFSGARQVVELIYSHTALHGPCKDSTKPMRHEEQLQQQRQPLLSEKRKTLATDDGLISDATEIGSIHDSVTAVDESTLHSIAKPKRKRRKISTASHLPVTAVENSVDPTFDLATNLAINHLPVQTLAEVQKMPTTLYPDDNVSLAELLRISAEQQRQQPSLTQPVVHGKNAPPSMAGLALPPMTVDLAVPWSPQQQVQQQRPQPPRAISSQIPYQTPLMAYGNMTAPTSRPNGNFAQHQIPVYIPPQYNHQQTQRTMNDLAFATNAGASEFPHGRTARPDLVQQMQARQNMTPGTQMNMMNPGSWYQTR